MKNTWNILFVLFLLFETACNSPSQSIKNTDLVAEDSICFPIDEHTYYASKSIFQFEENGHEYLSFLDAEYSQKINIYDIKNQKLIKTILLQKEGPNGMNVLSGCHPLNLNHFIITSWNGTFSLVNDKGEIEKKFDFWEKGVNFQEFDHISFSSYSYKPAIIKDSILYFSQSFLKHPRKKSDWNKIPMFAFANLNTGKTGWSELRYPLIFNKDEDFKNVKLYDPEICYTYTGKDVVISLGQYDSIMVSSDFKHKISYNAKSRYLAHAYPHLQDGQIDLFKNIQIQGKLPHYSHLEKMKKKNYSIILCGGLFLASCMSNNDKCLQKLFDEVGVEKSQIHNATHLVTILGNGCKGCIHKALSEIHNSTDTIYIIACKSKKTFNLIANKNIDDYSNVYLDTKSILVELDMAKNTPRVYLLNNGKYVSHSFYGNESPSKEANTTITFNTNEIDLGKISRTEKARIKFTIWNTGKNIVRISHIDLSCECLNIENEITEINPGDSTCLNIIFHPDDIGKFQREILLYGNFTGECF